MIRLAWRLSRIQIGLGVVALLGVAGVVVATGPGLLHLYHQLIPHCAQHHDCPAASTAFSQADRHWQSWLNALVVVAPGLIGVFWGAPLVARELETGSYQLAWTQGVSRARWLAGRVAVLALAAVVVAGLLSLLVTWWSSPLDRVNQTLFADFSLRAVVPACYALFAFALGVALGAVFRRTLPAMATTLVGFTAARLAVTQWVRPHLAAPLRVTAVLPVPSPGGAVTVGPAQASLNPNDWIISIVDLNRAGRVITPSGGVGPDGLISGLRVLRNGTVSIPGAGACPNVHVSVQGPHPLVGGHHPLVDHAVGVNTTVNSALARCIHQLGLHQVLSYQPSDRYWPFQWGETALFAVAAVALLTFSWWWVRRRIA